MGPFYSRKRIQDTIYRTSSSFKQTHFLPADKKTRIGRRSQQSFVKKGSGENLSGISRLLLKDIPGTKKERKNEADHRSFYSKQICDDSKFQNGNPKESQKFHSAQRLGLFIRPNGCIFACPDSSCISKIPSLLSKRQDLSIQGSSLRSIHEPICLHSSYDNNSFSPSQERYQSVPVSRRLAVKESKLSSSVGTQTFYHPSDHIIGSDYQSGKIRTDSIPKLRIHRDGISHSGQYSQSSSRQDSLFTTNNQTFPSQKESSCQTIPFSFGKTQCSSRLHNTRETSSQTFTNVSPSTVETTHLSSSLPNSDISKHQTSSSLVEQSTEICDGCSNQKSPSISPNVHRCKSDGVGGTSGTRGTIISRSLESSPSKTSYQHSRDDGNTSRVEMCPPSYCELNSSCFHRQHNRCVLHKSPGRNSLPRSVSRSLEHAELVSSKPDKHCCKTHTGEIQHSSRPSFKNIETNNNRMVPETISCKCSLSDDRISKHRSFCNKVESQVTPVCVPYSRQECIGNRCSHDELESHSRLCLSSISSHSLSAEQNSSIAMQDCSYSTSVAKQILVSRTTKSSDIPSHFSSSNSRSTGTITGKVSASKSSNSSTSRMGIIKQSITDRKFSDEVADHVSKARRASTRKVYDAKWKVFTDWANRRKIDPIKASPNVVADFLIYLFRDKKCQVSTIKGYRSMISNTLKFSSKSNIGTHPVLSELMKSFQMQRPVNRSLAQKWDLPFVLTYLCKEPFEPLNQASLIYLSMKTTFLLTMATARRISEVHAFAMDEEHLRFSSVDGSLTIRTQIGFLAKNQLPSKAPESIHIPRLSNSCTSKDFNRLLCPVRAIKIYLKRTKSIRGSRTRLFIPTKGNHDVKKSTISNWVKFTIKMAYKSITKRQMPFLKVKSHELRALSSSWAYFNFIPLEEVIKAAVWSSSSTFAKFYLRDFREQTANLQNLGPVVVAQKVVGGSRMSTPSQKQ